jgi:hypothetical protein
MANCLLFTPPPPPCYIVKKSLDLREMETRSESSREMAEKKVFAFLERYFKHDSNALL